MNDYFQPNRFQIDLNNTKNHWNLHIYGDSIAVVVDRRSKIIVGEHSIFLKLVLRLSFTFLHLLVYHFSPEWQFPLSTAQVIYSINWGTGNFPDCLRVNNFSIATLNKNSRSAQVRLIQLTISVLKDISRSSVDRCEKCRSFSSNAETWYWWT